MNIEVTQSRLLTISVVALVLVLAWIVVAIIANAARIVRGRAPVFTRSMVSRIALRLVSAAPVLTVVALPTYGAAAAANPESAENVPNPVNPLRHGESSLTNLVIGGAIGAGVLSRVRARNAAQLRSGVEIEPVAAALECELTRDGHDLRGERLDIAVRQLGARSDDLLLLVVSADGDIRAEFTTDVAEVGSWRRVRTRLMQVSSSVSTRDMIAALPPHSDRLPALFSVGTTGAGEVWVNLEMMLDFALECDEPTLTGFADEVWRGLTESLALSPFTVDVGIVGDPLIGRRVFMSTDTDARNSFVGATADSDSQMVMVSANASSDTSACPTLRRGQVATFGLRVRTGGCVLEPSGVAINPVGCSMPTLAQIDEVLDTPEPVKVQREPRPAHLAPACVPAHSFVVSVLGTPEVRHAGGDRVRFEKSKGEELVIWLSLHPNSRRRSLARDAMWSVPVRDGTFCNVTSDARRSLNAHEIAEDPDQWVGVTGNDELPLHRRIVSDLDIVRSCVEHARRWPEDGGVEALRHALSYVRGVPFAGSGYVWPDGASLAGEAVSLLTRAAQMCADLCADAGDDDGVMWATSRGLEVMPGHEGLTETRLRHLADRGRAAELRAEWESYCRVFADDTWGDGTPPRHMSEMYMSLQRDITD